MTPLEQARVVLIKEYLLKHKGNKIHAARALGCSIRALRNWINQYDELKKFRVRGHSRPLLLFERSTS